MTILFGLAFLGVALLAWGYKRLRCEKHLPPRDRYHVSTLRIGITSDETPHCPNCKETLSNRPKAKTKCRSCGKFMYVRTRPYDDSKVILNEEQVKKIEIEWMKVNGTYDEHLKKENIFETEKATLTKKLGGTPSDNDVKWSLLNKQLLDAMKISDWKSYLDARHNMAYLAYAEGKFSSALIPFYEACFLETNLLYLSDHKLDPKLLKIARADDFMPVSIVNDKICTLLACARNARKELSAVKEEYFRSADNLQTIMNLPIGPIEGWNQIEIVAKK